MKLQKLIAPVILGLGLLSVSAVAQADSITLGRTILLKNGNHAAPIPLVVCRKADALQVKAERNLRLEYIKVKFQNGGTQRINFYRDLNKNQKTDWRPFGYNRCVTHIEVYGNSDRSTAGVKVLGRTN